MHNKHFSTDCQFSVSMKSLVPVVAVLVVVLVIAVQEVQLVSNWGRRFGRSLDNGKTHRRQIRIYRQETFPNVEDENEGGQSFNEHLPVRNILP